MMSRRSAATPLLVCALAGAAACAPAAAAPADGRLPVVAAFYPLRFLAERVGGPDVTVTDLTRPGAEPHDAELSPRQVARVVDARVVVYLRGLQPAVDAAVDQEAPGRAFDAAREAGAGHAEEEHAAAEEHAAEEHAAEDDGHDGHDHGADLHVWLDPHEFAGLAGRLADRFAAADPAHAAGYAARAAALRAELTALDEEYAAGLAHCERREIVTGHAAFGHLARRYGLTQVAVTGLSPESEPEPRRLAEVAATARATGATTVFFETLVDPAVAATVAREVGARTAVLDPVEGLTTPGTDYPSVMRANLSALVTALGCTP